MCPPLSFPESPGNAMKALRKIILIGMKSSGKTTTARLLSQKLGILFRDMDAEIEKLHEARQHESLRFRDIFKKYGKEYFRTLETGALEALAATLHEQSFVLATGGGLPLTEENRGILKQMGTVVYLDVRQDVLYTRIVAGGVPAFFPYPDDPRRSLAEVLDVRRPIYAKLADITVECRTESPRWIADRIIQALEERDCED